MPRFGPLLSQKFYRAGEALHLVLSYAADMATRRTLVRIYASLSETEFYEEEVDLRLRIGGNENSIEDSGTFRCFDGIGDNRLAGKKLDILVRDSLTASPGWNDGHIHPVVFLCVQLPSTFHGGNDSRFMHRFLSNFFLLAAFSQQKHAVRIFIF